MFFYSGLSFWRRSLELCYWPTCCSVGFAAFGSVGSDNARYAVDHGVACHSLVTPMVRSTNVEPILPEWWAVGGAAGALFLGSWGGFKMAVSRVRRTRSFIGYVPTQRQYIDSIFRLAPVTDQDVVYDLGCGDGRVLVAAIKAGAGRAVGVDLDSDRVKRTRENVREEGLESRVAVIHGDLMEVDLAEATVVFAYLVPRASKALRPKFEAELKPGTRVVMESFPIPGWEADGRDFQKFHLYKMPPTITSCR